MPIGLEAMMSATLDCEAHLIWKAGLIPVMHSFQGTLPSQQYNPLSLTTSSPSMTTSTANMSPWFMTLTPLKLSKEVTDPELIAAMTKPFTSTKRNDALRSHRIRLSKSPLTLPFFFIQKKDSSLHLVQDY